MRASSEKCRSTLDNMLEGCQIIGFAWRHLYVNDAAARYGQRAKEELLGHTMMEVYPGIEDTEMFAHLQRCMEKRTPHRMENLFTFPDGSQGWFELSIEPVPEGIFILSLDITARKQAQEQIVRLHEILSTIRRVNQLIVEADDESLLLQKACDILVDGRNYKIAWIGFVSEDSYDVVPVAQSGLEDGYLSSVRITRDDSEHGGGPTGTAIKTGQPSVMRDVAGDERYKPWREQALKRGYLSSIAIPLKPEGRTIGALNVYSGNAGAFDQTEIKMLVELAGDISLGIQKIRQQEKLRSSENRYRTIFETTGTATVIIEEDATISLANSKFAQLSGYPKSEIEGKKRWTEFVAPEDLEKMKEYHRLRRTSADAAPTEYEFTFLSRGGNTRHVFLAVDVIPGTGQSVASLLDITGRKRTEAKLEQAASEWRTTFDSISDWVSIHDKDFKIVRANKAFADAFRMKPQEIIGRYCYEFIHGEKEASQYCAHREALENKQPSRREFYNPHLGIHMEVLCSPVFNDDGEVTSTVHIARDITERKKMEEQLVVTDRLASVGELASGVAHELNNPLTGVIGFSDLLLEKELSDNVKEDLRIINSEAKRAAQVARNLLAFARKHSEEKKPVNINNIIQGVLELRAYEQKVNNIEVNTRLAPDMPEIMASDFQLQQVFLNIIINAEYFMLQAHGRGSLAITTEKMDNGVRAAFADDGPGISRESLSHLFDPFFTTKEVGKGTGLGLSISYGIVSEHGGRMYAESVPGKGATFIVELPLPEPRKGRQKRTPGPSPQ